MRYNIVDIVLRRMAQEYERMLPYYEQMYSLALEQEKTLQQEMTDTERLIELIEQRQDLINSIEEINRGISLHKNEVCKVLGIEEFRISVIKENVTGSGVQEFEQSLLKITQLLQKIKDLDQKNEETLRQRINETKEKLKQIHNSKKANQAYNPKWKNTDGAFIDFSK